MIKRPLPIVTKSPRGIVPATAYDAEQINGYALNTDFDLKPRAKRSLDQLRKYWALLDDYGTTFLGDTYPTSGKLHEALMWDLGFVTKLATLDGREIEVRDSVAIESMEPVVFRVYFDRAMDRLAALTGVTVEQFDEARKNNVLMAG